MAVAELSKPPSNTDSMEKEIMKEKITDEYLLRDPDFGFTCCDRFPNSEVPGGFIEFAPDLAAEVICPPTS